MSHHWIDSKYRGIGGSKVEEQRYYEIMQKIHTLRSWYYGKYNIEPNTVMLNRETYDYLKSANGYIINVLPTNKPITIMGMKPQITDTDNIQLGYMIDVVE